MRVTISLIALIIGILAASITILYFVSEIFDVPVVQEIDEAVGQIEFKSDQSLVDQCVQVNKEHVVIIWFETKEPMIECSVIANEILSNNYTIATGIIEKFYTGSHTKYLMFERE